MSNSKSVFLEAVTSGDILKVSILLRQGIDIDARHSNGYTALHIATNLGMYNCVSFLLDMGADIYVYDTYGNTPAMYALISNRLDIMDLYLQHGLDINMSGGPHQKNVLDHAIQLGASEAIKHLLDNGADAYNTTNRIASPLVRAVQGALYSPPSISIIELLLKGRDVNHQHPNGQTLLHYAVASTLSKDIIYFLLKQGANPNIMDKTNTSPFLLCLTKPHMEDVVAECLEHGADPHIYRVFGQRPWLWRGDLYQGLLSQYMSEM